MKEYEFPAHIRKEEQYFVQSVTEHAVNTAEYAAESLSGIRLEKTCYLLGLVHDCGKLTAQFSEYIWRASKGEAVRKGSVNHTFAAVKIILNRFHDDGSIYHRIIAEIIAFALGAHHGLFDCIGPERKNGFTHRLESENELFTEASENFFHLCCTRDELEKRYSDALFEMMPLITRLVKMAERDKLGGELCYYFGSLSRLLLSALIDGDRRDTAEFMRGKKYPNKEHMSSDQWKRYLLRVEAKLSQMSNTEDIQRARANLSDICRDRAARPGGIYRLNLPTGAGKTLSAFRYALAHAAMQQHNIERIILVSPLLSILEQNARVIRDYLDDDSAILEHHSNVIHAESSQEEATINELLTDTWDAPVIITTLVQLLNTLFSGETAAIRRYHSLCNSIIVIDEVQTIPSKMLTMFQLTLSFLSEVCNTTIVLCSATQPADEYTQHPYYKIPEALVEYDEKLWSIFQRTKLQETEKSLLSNIPTIIKRELVYHRSLLVVCNKKDEAAYLFGELSKSEYDCFHLSAAMCVAHRTETLDALIASLKDKTRKTVCVSTQVIEAGVDISFECVIRLTAGMDNIVQSAGRCNRNRELESPATVFILNCVDENLSHLHEIEQAKNATEALLAEYNKNADAFDSNLASELAIRYYYKCLYNGMDVGSLDYPAGEHGTLYDLLASNTKYATENSESYGRYFLCQSFKTAGKLFSVFDTQTDTLLVPYGKGEDIIRQIKEIGDRIDPLALRTLHDLFELAKPFSVSVYSYQLDRLEKLGAVDRTCNGGILFLQPDYLGEIRYDNQTGLTT